MALPQPVDARLTQAAMFLVLTLDDGGRDGQISTEQNDQIRELLGDMSSLLRGVGFRVPDGRLSCITGIGSTAWDLLFGAPRPKDLHPFEEIRGVHVAPSTPGDLLFHIRAVSMDLCFELAATIVSRLEGAATVIDEVHGFKYFDERDLLGFVDGTENPSGQLAIDAAVIGDEDPDFIGGSYVIIQKYLHDLKKWNAIPTETQEDIIGRKKLSDIEQRDADKKSYAHNVLTNIEKDGEQLQIVRDNMPFGRVGQGEYGTYFIGYSREPGRTEQMLRNMFIGLPPGNYDRLLDVSTAVTGALFFIPTADFLDGAPDMTPPSEAAKTQDAAAPDGASPDPADRTSPGTSSLATGSLATGSLGIGSLKEDSLP